MPLTPAQIAVQQAFNQAVIYFNAHQLQNLMTCIDQDAIVYSINGALGYHPKHVVKVYFKEEFQDNPTFTPAGIPIPQMNPNDTGATVWGQATWIDENHPAGNPLQILYTFTFVLRAGVWLLSTMWGS